MSVLASLSGELAALTKRAVPHVIAVHAGTVATRTTGSGFVIDSFGHMVTNNHVISDFGEQVHVSHGEHDVVATRVGSDVETDLAVLRLPEASSTHLVWREEPAHLGELCVALGSPFGIYRQTATLGMISGTARMIEFEDRPRPIERAIQTDALIYPGSSGGPLLDATGRVLGVNTSVDSRAEGIGFAIPASIASWVVSEIIEFGRVERATLGIAVNTRTVELDGRSVIRVAVTRINESGAGNGLEVDDVILTIDGEVCDERWDLYEALRRDAVGRALELELLRNGRRIALTVHPQARS